VVAPERGTLGVVWIGFDLLNPLLERRRIGRAPCLNGQ
jgi:hypothetical protein